MTAHHTHCPNRWPVWRTPAQQVLRAMLGELEGLVITGGESSVRLSPAGVDQGRWLAGFSPVGISPKRLMGLPDRLGMPTEGAAHFRSQWPQARQIGLAVEQTDAQLTAKVYLEYALPAPDFLTRAPEYRKADLHIESCKWRIDAPSLVCRQTEYWRMSGIDGMAMADFLRTAQGLGSAAQPACAGVAQMLETALQASPHWQGYRLLLVREPGSTRQGFGVRFYDSRLRVRVVLVSLSNVLYSWGLQPLQLSSLMSAIGGQELGWLHIGVDAHSQPYLIIYGALSSADTRAVLMPAVAAGNHLNVFEGELK